MKKLTLPIIMILGLIASGCVMQPQQQEKNNVSQNITPEMGRLMAKDTAAQISRLFAMGKTTLDFEQPVKDEFGTELINRLRQQGFAVHEKILPSTAIPTLFTAKTEVTQESTLAPGVSITYVVGESQDLYYVHLKAGRESLTRTYVVSDSRVSPVGVTPAGHWVRQAKE